LILAVVCLAELRRNNLIAPDFSASSFRMFFELVISLGEMPINRGN
jgi:hypothetical protein